MPPPPTHTNTSLFITKQSRKPSPPIQDLYGGFLDPQVADDFAYYADTAFRELGHLVRHWVTVRARRFQGWGGHVFGVCVLGRLVTGAAT
jgi:beta-glucosidase/6-phospho-beta-glucosidase/beta-galactosidase